MPDYKAGDEFLHVPLTCPLSHKRLENPVRIPGVDAALSMAAVEAAIDGTRCIDGDGD